MAINVDAELSNADWVKKTKDGLADLKSTSDTQKKDAT
jgi:hypothetical protein